MQLGEDADADFNIVTSAFGKGNRNIVGWLNKGYATYINKEKALAFLSHQSAPIAAATANTEFSHAVNVVRNFENGKRVRLKDVNGEEIPALCSSAAGIRRGAVGRRRRRVTSGGCAGHVPDA